MPLTRTTFLRLIKISSGILIVILIATYALWRSLNYARGPHIIVTSPLDGSSVSASTTIIRGRVERSNDISLNGKAITIDEQGNFSETIIVFPGTNIITLEVRDQFKRSVREQIRVLGL